jgi:hypothetical protein
VTETPNVALASMPSRRSSVRMGPRVLGRAEVAVEGVDGALQILDGLPGLCPYRVDLGVRLGELVSVVVAQCLQLSVLAFALVPQRGGVPVLCGGQLVSRGAGGSALLGDGGPLARQLRGERGEPAIEVC